MEEEMRLSTLWLKLRCKYAELPTADAIIAATAIAMSCDYILTDDKHIKQINETKTKWI
jgi:predicted nucleic acid-binding protein